jgi:fibro-slime domain-containing protein
MTRALPSPRLEPGRPFLMALTFAALAAAGCGQETTFSFDSPTPQPTTVPAQDPHGDPPQDWTACATGYQGYYYNLSSGHPDVEPEEPTLPDGTTPDRLDWWDSSGFAFTRPSTGLDFGTDWFPVDQGLDGDPAYFSVRWTAWIRAFSSTTLTLSLGSADDAWVLIDGKVVASLPGIHPFDVQSFDIPLAARQYPLDIYFAQRALPDSAFRLLILGGDVTVCAPTY